MKILISADMEGATGVTWPADVLPGTPQWERCRSMFTSDVNAAVLGFFDGGADEVLINEAHWSMRNLLLEQLDERAEMLTGRHKTLSMVEGVQHGDVDGIAFIGYHTGAGTEGVLAHTYLANSITGVWVNGVRASEGLLNAHVVAEYGVPVVLVTGDDLTCDDALGYAPEARKVAVKDYVSRYAAVCRTPARTAADIRAAAKEAAALAVRHEPVQGGPFTIELEFDAEHLSMAATVVPGVGAPASAGSPTRTTPCTTASAPSRRSPRSSRPRWRSSMADQAFQVDEQALDEVVTFTSELIRIDTTNRGGGDCQERPAAEYAAEQLAEAGLEPTLLERTKGRTNVVARIAGTDPSADALLVHGHLDVVPAEPADWSVHPFSGEIRDGVVWGRGAIDMKNMDAMILAVVRPWARAGVRPRRDIVSPSPPTRRPAPRTAPASSPTSTPASSRAAPRASANRAPSPSTTARASSSTRSRRASAAPAGSGSPPTARRATARRSTTPTPSAGSPPPSPGSASTSGRCGSRRPCAPR